MIDSCKIINILIYIVPDFKEIINFRKLRSDLESIQSHLEHPDNNSDSPETTPEESRLNPAIFKKPSTWSGFSFKIFLQNF